MSTHPINATLGEEPYLALRRLMRTKKVDQDEALRRAISWWRYIENELAAGHTICVYDGREYRKVNYEGEPKPRRPWRIGRRSRSDTSI